MNKTELIEKITEMIGFGFFAVCLVLFAVLVSDSSWATNVDTNYISVTGYSAAGFAAVGLIFYEISVYCGYLIEKNS